MKLWSYYDGDTCHYFRTRADLGEEPHRATLAAALAAKRPVTCGCQGAIPSHLRPKLIPYPYRKRGPFLRKHPKTVTHDFRCPNYGNLEPMYEPLHQPGKLKPTIRMFMEEAEAADRAPPIASDEPTGSGGTPEETFVHFIQREFTRASLKCFAAINEGKSFCDLRLKNPTFFEIFNRLRQIMHEPILEDGQTPAAGLEQIGHKLFWGLCKEPLVDYCDDALAMNEGVKITLAMHWECDGRKPNGTKLEIPLEILSRLGGKVRANNHVIPPPYFYAAVVKPIGDVNQAIRYFRIPIAHVGKCIWPVESQAERQSIEVLALEGVAMIKLHVKADLRILGQKLWPFGAGMDDKSLSRPDIFAFVDDRVHITYITDTDDLVYHEKVDASVAKMKQHFSRPEIIVRKIQARDLNRENWRMFLS
jgi:hypothetical protein